MIDEAIGKILGMAMAYGASALGMFVAYVNYRKRVVRADKVMTPAAWAVIAISILVVGGAVVVVAQLATEPAPIDRAAAAEDADLPAPVDPRPSTPPPDSAERSAWPLTGIVIPAGIFLFATLITAALHRHFTAHGH